MSMTENVYTSHCIEIKQMMFKINMVVDMESLLSQMVKCSVAQAPEHYHWLLNHKHLKTISETS